MQNYKVPLVKAYKDKINKMCYLVRSQRMNEYNQCFLIQFKLSVYFSTEKK